MDVVVRINSPGIKQIEYVGEAKYQLTLQHVEEPKCSYHDYYPDIEFLVIRPDRYKDLSDKYNAMKQDAIAKNISNWPHKCPQCGKPAYINLFDRVDCQAKCH